MIQVFRVFIPASTLVLGLFEALVIISAFFLSIFLLLEQSPADYLLNSFGLVSIALVTVSILAGVYFQDLYSDVRVQSRLLLAQQLLMTVGIGFLIQALVSVIFPNLYIPVRVMILGSVMATVAMFAGRLVFSAYLLPRVASERLLLVGDSPLLADIASYLGQHSELGIQVAGLIRWPDPAEEGGLTSEQAPGHGARLEGLFDAFKSKRIVIGMSDGLNALQASELLELRFLGYSIQEAAGVYAKIFNREGLNGLGPAQLLYSKEFEPGTRVLFFQAMANWLIALACLVLLLPVMVIIAALVRLGGPVFFRQVRCGRNGFPFTMYSFRVAAVDPDGGVPLVGRILARTGLYGLPQLFNILCGHMSMVGPKPQRPEFVRELSRHIPFHLHRFKVRPGMTGWGQIQNRRHPGLPDSMVELEYDLYYIKYMSATMDTFVIVQAIKNILLWGGEPW